MAGYRTSGNDYVNATAINTQIVKQREAYNTTSGQTLDFSNGDPGAGMGIARSTTPLFSMPTGIAAESFSIFKDLDTSSSQGADEFNPDFPNGVSMSSDESLNIFDDVQNQPDNPDKKGPNLIVAPDINNLSIMTTQSTAYSQFKNRGFGWKDDRNEPGTEPARIGEYFSKHYTSSGSEKPTLGEAKSPSNDTNIDYNQPD